MANLNLSIVIPDGKVTRTKNRIVAHLPNTETIEDPAWIDPEDGSKPNQIAKFTDTEWIEYNLKKVLRAWDSKGDKKLAALAADKSDMFEI